MKTLATAIVTLLLFAAFLSWTMIEVACTAFDVQCYADDPCGPSQCARESASWSGIRLPSAFAERN